MAQRGRSPAAAAAAAAAAATATAARSARGAPPAAARGNTPGRKGDAARRRQWLDLRGNRINSNGVPYNSLRTRNTALNAWRRFSSSRGEGLLLSAADCSERIIAFAAALAAKRYRFHTVSQYCRDVVSHHEDDLKIAGVRIDRTTRKEIYRWRSKCLPPKEKPVVSGATLKTILSSLRRTDFNDMAILAAILFGYATCQRVSNVASAGGVGTGHTVRIGDVSAFPTTTAPKGLCIVQRSSKSVQPGTEAARKIWVGVCTDAAMCPTTAVLDFLRLAASTSGVTVTPSDPLFLLLSPKTPSGTRPVTDNDINRFLRKRQHELGLFPGMPLTSHPVMRKSGATALTLAGADQRMVSKHGGWNIPGHNNTMERSYNYDGKRVALEFTDRQMTTPDSTLSTGEPVFATLVAARASVTPVRSMQ